MRLSGFLCSLFLLTSCLAPAQKPKAVALSGSAGDMSLVAKTKRAGKGSAETAALAAPPATATLSAESELPQTVSDATGTFMLIGAESGLYKVTATRTTVPLWTDGKVTKILHYTLSADDGATADRWYFLTNKGILTSSDLVSFDYRNDGLPFLTIKEYDGTTTSFRKQIHQLKDLAIHPTDRNILVTATKDNVFLTRDGGVTWKSIGSMSIHTAGLKAVAVATMNVPGTGKPAVTAADGTVTPAEPPKTQLVVFMSHPIYGFSYCLVDAAKPTWTDVKRGFDNMRGQTYPDEISDIMPVVFMGADGFPTTEVFVSQSYLPNIYRFDWNEKKAVVLYTGTEPAETIDALFWDGAQVLYSKPGAVAAFNPTSGKEGALPPAYHEWKPLFGVLARGDVLYSAHIPDGGDGIDLGELWLLKPDLCTSPYADKALNRKAVYIPANHVTTQAGIDRYKKLIKTNKLDALVIDMKDDYGLLRYETQDPLVKEKGFVSRYRIDIDTFVSQFKADDVYLVARIVTFKDKHLSQYANGKYAVWDRVNNRPWVGTKGSVEVKNEAGEVTGTRLTYYDENWVDPYSPEVWEYDIKIAQELITRGFDEIQFDYIRFPTDGKNMGNASYRWKSDGMDKESALVSFLSYARANIDAPIGIDIYGANGWYRSGTRTGQDVELLAEYVDVICPMFYPSHFEQSFLNYAPYSERPYRIYYYGTYRNTVIGRNRIVVRPWVQAFYLGVSYDRQYYDKKDKNGYNAYVRQQVYGVRDSVDKGYMYWNNSGRYDDISPDVGDSEYTGAATEAVSKYRHPALSGGDEATPFSTDSATDIAVQREDVSVLDSTHRQELGEAQPQERRQSRFPALGDIHKLWQAYDTGA